MIRLLFDFQYVSVSLVVLQLTTRKQIDSLICKSDNLWLVLFWFDAFTRQDIVNERSFQIEMYLYLYLRHHQQQHTVPRVNSWENKPNQQISCAVFIDWFATIPLCESNQQRPMLISFQTCCRSINLLHTLKSISTVQVLYYVCLFVFLISYIIMFFWWHWPIC